MILGEPYIYSRILPCTMLGIKEIHRGLKRDLSSNEEMEILLCGPSFGSKSILLLLDIREFKYFFSMHQHGFFLKK